MPLLDSTCRQRRAPFNRIGVSLWLALWVLTLPLSHIHTIADAHRGLPHTIFSPELPGEYSIGSTKTVRTESRRANPCPHHLSGGQSHPELTFTAPIPQEGTFYRLLQRVMPSPLDLVYFPESAIRQVPANDISVGTQSFLRQAHTRAPPAIARAFLCATHPIWQSA